MSFYVPSNPGNIRKKHMTGAQQQRHFDSLRNGKKSFFANKELCGEVSIRRMPRPSGKVYKG